MADIGRYNTLVVKGSSAHGFYLDGGEHGDIFLPIQHAPPGTAEGDTLEIFVYLDSEDRPVATSKQPLVMAGEFAGLEVTDYQPGMGAWLYWGLEKDLLLPIREQAGHIEPGDVAVVYVYVDPRSGRLVATMRLDRHLDYEEPHYAEGECVDLVITAETPLGYKAAVNHRHSGLLYRAELGVLLSPGQRLKGYVKTVRPDGKLDLCLDPSGYSRVKPLAQLIMEALHAEPDGLDLDDKSHPEDVRERFGASKKAFKQALGALYRDRRIIFAPPGVRLAPRDP
jgi:predicted RNA-binding protein (virulence factor B family)